MTDWSRISYSTKSSGLRDLLEPAGHLPDPRPELLGLELEEVRVVVALLGDPVGELHGEGHGSDVRSWSTIATRRPLRLRLPAECRLTGRYNSRRRHGPHRRTRPHEPRPRTRRRRAGRRCRHHRHLPALPGAGGGLLRRSWSRRAAASAAPGTGTATPAAASTPRATPTATSSRGSCSTSGSGSEHFAAAARDRALPQPRRRPVRPPPPHALRRCGSPPPCATRPSGTWAVTLDDGTHDPGPLPRRRHRRALGALHARRARPRRLPGRRTPHRAVADRAGRLRRQARRGRRHLVERRAGGARPSLDEVATLTVYQRTANWCTPLNNTPITPEEQAQLRADFEELREVLNTSLQRLPPPGERAGRVRRLRRGAPGVLREDVEQPGLHEAHEQLLRPAVQRGGERRVVRVHRRQDPRHRRTTPRPPSS